MKPGIAVATFFEGNEPAETKMTRRKAVVLEWRQCSAEDQRWLAEECAKALGATLDAE